MCRASPHLVIRPSLTELNLEHNAALCDVKTYRMLVLRRIPNLSVLDGKVVQEHERTEALHNQAKVTDELLRAHCFAKRRSGWSASTSNGKRAEDERGEQSPGQPAQLHQPQRRCPHPWESPLRY